MLQVLVEFSLAGGSVQHSARLGVPVSCVIPKCFVALP